MGEDDFWDPRNYTEDDIYEWGVKTANHFSKMGESENLNYDPMVDYGELYAGG